MSSYEDDDEEYEFERKSIRTTLSDKIQCDMSVLYSRSFYPISLGMPLDEYDSWYSN